MPEPPTPEELDRWEKLAQEATPGPWSVEYSPNPHTVARVKLDYVNGQRATPDDQNARFIAEARTALPRLIAALRQA